MTQIETAQYFRSLHRRAGLPLLLPNAWDVASARLVAQAGAAAVATTSAGVSWSHGVADGEHLGRDRALDLITRVVAAVDVPVTADVEGGYAEEPSGVAETIRGVIAAGAAGVNLEDAHHGSGLPLRPVEAQVERIAAARAVADAEGVPLFVNARVDTYVGAVGDPALRLEETLSRAGAYVAAGADGIFVPGVTDPELVSALVAGIDAPVNVLAGPGAPTTAELARLGVARISLGSSIAEAAYAVVRRSTKELLATGSYTALTDALDYADVNTLLRSRP
ncbi:isocitrate lyase/PEP mutase family protein [Actinopolymorpha pittospori]|uniref:2-methylisocitrate lyase-like PEP mutase family enzyme n=1 Tax=Actinopolymorpha pittospori TaxID=648752 RepID=A0A927N5G0_9ACTN|nr:isocitrate lyase/phosphoenolpyruvate mutase family protein [Actinopolymorpha pittospori]MBE1611333.1 2-methylisocitrate lyase-like PEP mutase family enzyme [Actinopolymorpha pittospori]